MNPIDVSAWWIAPTLEVLLRVAALFVVPRGRTPQSAAAWLLVIFFLPWFGLPLYLLIGRVRPDGDLREVLDAFPGRHPALLERMRALVEAHELAPPAPLHPTAELGRRLGRFRALRGSDAEFLVDYEGWVDRLVADVDAARDHVHLGFYIVEPDRVGRAVGEALVRAAARGVRCRLLADAFGAGRRGRRFVAELARRGVETALFNPFHPLAVLRRRVDHRNHRKIAVVDGVVAHAGSQNLVDSHFRRGLDYRELMVRLRGPIVSQLQVVFAADWFASTGTPLDDPRLLPDPGTVGTAPAQAIPSGMAFAAENFAWVLVDLLHRARRSAVLVTPYYLPDVTVAQAIAAAATRGVDVRLIVPVGSDTPLVAMAQRPCLREALAAGVRVLRRPDVFLHAKCMTVDDDVSVVGSGNLDVRSLALNEEITLVFYDRGVTERLRALQARWEARSEPLEPERGRAPVRHAAENLARLVSPIL